MFRNESVNDIRILQRALKSRSSLYFWSIRSLFLGLKEMLYLCWYAISRDGGYTAKAKEDETYRNYTEVELTFVHTASQTSGAFGKVGLQLLLKQIGSKIKAVSCHPCTPTSYAETLLQSHSKNPGEIFYIVCVTTNRQQYWEFLKNS